MMMPSSRHIEIIARLLREVIRHTESLQKWFKKEQVPLAEKVVPCITTMLKIISMEEMVLLVLKYRLELDLHLPLNIKSSQTLQSRCMEMEQQIKVRSMRPQIWLLSGNCQLHSFVRIICMVWEQQTNVPQLIQTILQEEIRFQVLRLMLKMF